MFRFVSSTNPVVLKRAYISEFNVNLLQNKLNGLMHDYPEIRAVLPKKMTAKNLLVGNFRYLSKVYCGFTGYVNAKSVEEKAAIIKAFVDGGFRYSSHESKIGKFLVDVKNGFEIHNCVYCDLEDVTSFIKANGTKVRKFETEHVLDKGECPLVALSLYNFVPSCGTCNSTAIKGTKTIGDTEDEIARLSPSSEGYDFEGKVRFEVKMINPCAVDLNAAEHMGDYEVDFIVQETIYQKSIDLFELKARYNVNKIKTELLKWRGRRRLYTDNKVMEMAHLMGDKYENMLEEIFELQLRKREHYTMEKARRDVMLM